MLVCLGSMAWVGCLVFVDSLNWDNPLIRAATSRVVDLLACENRWSQGLPSQLMCLWGSIFSSKISFTPFGQPSCPEIANRNEKLVTMIVALDLRVDLIPKKL